MADFLRVVNLNKVFKTGNTSAHVLKDINVTINEGEFICVVGPSGCGKSTFMRCIAGLETATRGDLVLQGQAINTPPTNMGVVFQRDLLMEWRNVIDNVLVAAEFHGLKRQDYEARARELLHLFGLGSALEHYPRHLSGGMRQRVSICRALLTDPQLLLMDEPFGALDPFTRDELNVELQRMWLDTNKTVVFITHSISEAVFLADRIIVMSRNPGRIEEIISISLERPRSLDVQDSKEFADYVSHIRETFKRLGIYKS